MNSISYFDSIAEDWNVIRSEYFEEKLKYKVLSKLDIKDKVCADLGCGTGFISLILSMDSSIVFSVDSSKNMLQVLKNTYSKGNIKNIYPIKGTMEDIPLFDDSIDVVVTNMALHHVVEAELGIKEMYRILKEDGEVLISDVMEHSGEWAKHEMHDEWLGFRNEQIEGWLKKAGFEDIEIENTQLSCKGYSSTGEYTETAIFMAKAKKRGNKQ